MGVKNIMLEFEFILELYEVELMQCKWIILNLRVRGRTTETRAYLSFADKMEGGQNGLMDKQFADALKWSCPLGCFFASGSYDKYRLS